MKGVGKQVSAGVEGKDEVGGDDDRKEEGGGQYVVRNAWCVMCTWCAECEGKQGEGKEEIAFGTGERGQAKEQRGTQAVAPGVDVVQVGGDGPEAQRSEQAGL